MNALLSTFALAAFGAGTPPPAGPAPVIAIQSINPTTSLLVVPATGQAVVAIEVNGLLLLTTNSPALAISLTDANAPHTGGIQLVTGLR